jgi:P-type Ca2+ transporter type 2C
MQKGAEAKIAATADAIKNMESSDFKYHKLSD